MQFSTVVTTILAVAMTASANPTVRRNGGGGGGGGGTTPASCSTSGEKPVCCDGLLGVLTCAVSVLGGNCNGNSYCCQTDAAAVSAPFLPCIASVILISVPQGVLINISALNCVQL